MIILEEDEEGWTKTTCQHDTAWTKQDRNQFMNFPSLINCPEQMVGDYESNKATKSNYWRDLIMIGSTKLATAKCEEFVL
jgi:hypothetical protein